MKVVNHLTHDWRGCGSHSMSLNQWAKAFLVPSSYPGFHLTSQIWANKCGGNSMTPHLYPHPLQRKVVKHPVYTFWIDLHLFHVGLEPHALHHHGIVQRTAVTQDFNRLPKSGPTSVVVTAWWHIHISIHSIWRFSITLFLFGEDVVAIPCGLRASSTAPWHRSVHSSDQGFQLTSKIWANKCSSNGMVTHHISIHNIWRFSITLFLFGENVGAIPCGFRASTTAPWHRLAPSSDPWFHLTSQICANKCGGNGMVTHPYPNPHHMKVVNHLVYV